MQTTKRNPAGGTSYINLHDWVESEPLLLDHYHHKFSIWVLLQLCTLRVLSLDENLDFIHVGNLQDRANFLHISFIYIEFHPILCRKCEEISCFGKQYMQEIFFFGVVYGKIGYKSQRFRGVIRDSRYTIIHNISLEYQQLSHGSLSLMNGRIETGVPKHVVKEYAFLFAYYSILQFL